ncbi:hypothetical protein BOTBODRAFT_182177 [Botryobasidium botryosum FD-172 SS1]|uniref:Uncharacterized protein n=1 Tax=Botryobasidium botryosum (strain FD-172 SS1) TaxID=930990 RepID=A0A067LUE6_BOTB1|nr:hypothetical protein BOTBODRAFT_182177 [Botryobasidium botryosum FD-172 SS1]
MATRPNTALDLEAQSIDIGQPNGIGEEGWLVYQRALFVDRAIDTWQRSKALFRGFVGVVGAPMSSVKELNWYGAACFMIGTGAAVASHWDGVSTSKGSRGLYRGIRGRRHDIVDCGTSTFAGGGYTSAWMTTSLLGPPWGAYEPTALLRPPRRPPPHAEDLGPLSPAAGNCTWSS